MLETLEKPELITSEIEGKRHTRHSHESLSLSTLTYLAYCIWFLKILLASISHRLTMLQQQTYESPLYMHTQRSESLFYIHTYIHVSCKLPILRTSWNHLPSRQVAGFCVECPLIRCGCLFPMQVASCAMLHAWPARFLISGFLMSLVEFRLRCPGRPCARAVAHILIQVARVPRAMGCMMPILFGAGPFAAKNNPRNKRLCSPYLSAMYLSYSRCVLRLAPPPRTQRACCYCTRAKAALPPAGRSFVVLLALLSACRNMLLFFLPLLLSDLPPLYAPSYSAVHFESSARSTTMSIRAPIFEVRAMNKCPGLSPALQLR